MKHQEFKIGQIVYVIGRYRAKVVSVSGSLIECDVYEGVYAKPPVRAVYDQGFIWKTRLKISQ